VINQQNMDLNFTSCYNPFMPYKSVEDRKAASKRHYYANKQQYLEKNNRRRELMRAYLRIVKESKPCSDCGMKYPFYVMDFDHLGDKRNIISQIVLQGSRHALEAEIKKCELVCANCHRIRTHKRRVSL
jgi:hypothetical protein